MPEKRTEVRLGQVADRRSYRTEKPNETIRTTLGIGRGVFRPVAAGSGRGPGRSRVDGRIAGRARRSRGRPAAHLAARPGVSPRPSASSSAWTCRPAISWRRCKATTFAAGKSEKTGQGESLEVDLLRAAKDHEEFTLRLWRAGRRQQGQPIVVAKIGTVPSGSTCRPIAVPEAVMHTGQLTIRRSGLLELRTLESAGLSRGLPADAATADEPDP